MAQMAFHKHIGIDKMGTDRRGKATCKSKHTRHQLREANPQPNAVPYQE